MSPHHTTPRQLRDLYHDDDGDRAMREAVYYASGATAPIVDRSGEYDYTQVTDAALAQAEKWARYYVQSGVRRREVHRLRAIHAEQQRRLDAARARA